MKRSVWTAVAIVVIAAAGAAAGRAAWKAKIAKHEPTFARDVAPLVFAKCAPCHRPGESGPFSLLTYEDVSRRGRQIKRVTGLRIMPPWKAVGSEPKLRGDRRLTQEQIDLLARWVDHGAPLGDPKDLPPPPHWPSGWQLGEPDVVIELPEGYPVPAEGGDIYRNFVLPAPVQGTHYVAAWEFRPGSRAVHHAILNLDRLGLARRRDAEDAEPGFAGMDVGNVQNADGLYLVWAPGSAPTPPNAARSWRIDEHTDLVLQLHMQPRGKAESVRPKIGLYFAPGPPTEHVVQLRLGDEPIDIPAGDTSFVMRSSVTLPADVQALSVFPHAHYVGKTVHAWATLPDGATKELLRIDDWDFNWQDKYTYAEPLLLPAGTVLSMAIGYDNSDANPRNPSRPPRRVTFGERSTDEMGNLTFELLPRDARGATKLRVAQYEHEVRGGTARSQYNLANALADDGKPADAMAHDAKAIAIDPAFVPARFNLGSLLLATGDLDGAIRELRAALTYDPKLADARVNLGHALEDKGSLDDAIAEYRQAASLAPRSAIAHASLGAALAKKGDARGAESELDVALAITPADGRIRAALAALRTDAGVAGSR